MSEKKIVVPDGMLSAVAHALFDKHGTVGQFHPYIPTAIETALRWLSENPIVPTRIDVEEFLSPEMMCMGHFDFAIESAVRWQRRMLIAPEPEVPEGIADLLKIPDDIPFSEDPMQRCRADKEVSGKIVEAYYRGLKAGTK